MQLLKSIFKFIAGLLFLAIYSIGLLCLVDFWILYGLAVLFLAFLWFWFNRQRESHNQPPIGRGWKIFAAILFIAIFAFGQVLDIIGTYTVNQVYDQAKAKNIPLTSKELWTKAGYDEIVHSQNGGTLLLGVAELYPRRYQDWIKTLSDEEQTWESSNDDEMEIVNKMPGKIEALIASVQDLQPILDHALAMPTCRITRIHLPDDPIKFMELDLSHLGTIRNTMDILRYQALLQSQKAAWLDAGKTVQTMNKLADSLKGEPFLISKLVRIALQKMVLYTIQQIVQQHGTQIPPEVLQQFQTTLQTWYNSSNEELSKSLESEIIFAAGIASLPKLKYLNFNESLVPVPYLMFIPHGYIKLDLAYMMQSEISASQMAQNEKTMREYIETKPENHYYPLSYHLEPSWKQIFIRQLEHHARIRCTWIALSITLEQQKTQTLPSNLDFIQDPNMRQDPFTGQSLLYQVRENSYVIYSCGKDKGDDHALFVAPPKKDEDPNTPGIQSQKPEPTLDIGIEMKK